MKRPYVYVRAEQAKECSGRKWKYSIFPSQTRKVNVSCNLGTPHHHDFKG